MPPLGIRPLEEYELLPENAHLQSSVVIAADWIGFICLAGPSRLPMLTWLECDDGAWNGPPGRRDVTRNAPLRVAG